MICVSIARGRHKQMIAEHRHLVERGAQLVELRLDYIRRTVDLKRLIANRPGPVIATCRRQEDGGMWEGTEPQRLMLLRAAIIEGVEYVDIELDVADQIRRYGKTQRIISYHDFRETPEDLDELYQRMKMLDPDIIKIATIAHTPHDNVRILRMQQAADMPTVAHCMGDIGTPSRILSGRYGAPFAYAAFHHDRQLAPGQLSYKQMRDMYRFDSIDKNTAVYGVMADPIAHSVSPQVHNAIFKANNSNCVYAPFRVPREDAGAFLTDCTELGVRGLSVTIPHKEVVISYLTKIHDAAQEIGAVNTILFEGDERIGYNTDFQAIIDCVQHCLMGSGANKIAGQHVLILGAGGAARAAAYAFTQLGARVTMTARRMEQAQEVAVRFNAKAIDWDARQKEPADFVVNATPIGMHPRLNEAPYNPRSLQRTAVVFDMVYNPEQTLLIKNARERGCRTITGVDMFVRQAALQCNLFAGKDAAPLDLIRDVVRRSIGAARY